MERLRRQCARMEVCSFDARRKALKALDGDAAAAEEILESLVADGYVDDRRYGAAFADTERWRIETGGDGLHFSPRGHRIFAVKLAQMLRVLL